MFKKTLTIKNFKSVKSLTLHLKQVNVLIGQPNSGKSNILESLGLLSALNYDKYSSIESRKRSYFSQSFVRHKHIMNLFYENDIGRKIVIDLDDQQFVIESFENGYTMKCFDPSFDTQETLLTFNEKGSASSTYNTLILDKISNVKFYRFKLLSKFPFKQTHFLLPPEGANLTTILQSNFKLRELIYNLLEPFELELNIRTEEDEIEFLKKIEYGRVSIPFSLVAETIQRLIFLLSIVSTNKNSTIVLEEPETHLFPYYTKYLAETIAIQLENSGNQYVFSTHNPYFLTSLLEKTPKGKLALFAVRYKNKVTEVRELSNKEIEEMLYYSEDPFFNIDGYFK